MRFVHKKVVGQPIQGQGLGKMARQVCLDLASRFAQRIAKGELGALLRLRNHIMQQGKIALRQADAGAHGQGKDGWRQLAQGVGEYL